MKSIKEVLIQMAESGKYGPIIVIADEPKEEKRLKIIEVEAILFYVFTKSRANELNALKTAQSIGKLIEMVEGDENALLSVSDAAIIIGTFVELNSSNPRTPDAIIEWFLNACEKLNIDNAVHIYKIKKNILLKEQE